MPYPLTVTFKAKRYADRVHLIEPKPHHIAADRMVPDTAIRNVWSGLFGPNGTVPLTHLLVTVSNPQAFMPTVTVFVPDIRAAAKLLNGSERWARVDELRDQGHTLLDAESIVYNELVTTIANH